MKSLVLHPLVRALLAASLGSAASLAGADVVTDWNGRAGTFILEARMGTPPAARTMAVVQTAVYGAVNAITRQDPPLPIVVANINGFWTPFLSLLDHMRTQAFIRAGLEVRFGVVADAGEIVPRVQALYDATGGRVDPGALAKL